MLAVLLSSFAFLPALGLHFENDECVVSGSDDSSSTCYYDTDVSTIHHVIKKHGYDIETFSVTTPDGYILKIFHILKPNSAANKEQGPVFLQHGLTANSAMWTRIGNRSLPFVLVDHGYDVWLGNIRGTTYANKHLKLTVNDSKYWNFNLDKIAAIDIPEQLKFVYNKTGKKSLYIGHSMGNTLVFMYSSTSSQEAGELLRGVVAIAPTVYLHRTFMEYVKPMISTLTYSLNVLPVKGIFFEEKYIRMFLTDFCKNGSDICLLFMLFAAGKPSQFRKEDFPVLFKAWPSGTSLYQFDQYMQFAQSKRFQKFDYGRSKNLKKYGTNIPPAYNLSSVNLPVCLLYGKRDIFYKQKNLERLYNELGTNQKSKHSVPSETSKETFNHIDFLFPSEKYPYSDWLFRYCLESAEFQNI